MRKLGWVCGLVGLLSVPSMAFAINCTASGATYTQYSQSQANNLLTGSLACYPATTGLATYINQEAHYTGGRLGDYKRGTGAVDPTRTNIGSWAVDSTGKVTYTYAPGNSTFSYIVFGLNGANPGNNTYDFCASVGATPIKIRIVKTSTGPC